VVAISTDDVETLRRFRASLGAPFPFLSDPGGVVSARYAGVWGRSANRVTVTIDRDGTIARVTEGLGAILPEADVRACPTARPGAEPSST